MSTLIPFVKMHGLGNDFVIIEENFLPENININEFAINIANRQLGVGCDQFIIYKNQQDEVIMNIYNQDGSKAKACGNVSRCLSRLIFDKNGKENIILNVDGRKILCKYAPENISVDMGLVSFQESWMPSSDQLWNFAARHMIEPKEMICVDVANPHLVIFSRLSDEDKQIIGQNCQDINLFPQGVNVNFAQAEGDKIYLKVWERGTGFTYACGSGAVATFAAACKLGFASEKAEIIFKLGSLKMQTQENAITMSGRADYVFHGVYIYG